MCLGGIAGSWGGRWGAWRARRIVGLRWWRRIGKKVGGAGGAAEDEGRGFAGRLEEAGAGGGGGLGVIQVGGVERVAALLEGVDGGDGALGAEDILAHEGEVACGLEFAPDVGALEPLDDGGDHDVEVAGELDDGNVGLEEGGEEGALDVGGDGFGGEDAAETFLVEGFLRLGERIGWGPVAGEAEAVDEVEAGGRVVVGGVGVGVELGSGRSDGIWRERGESGGISAN